jgi:hypothetical protein
VSLLAAFTNTGIPKGNISRGKAERETDIPAWMYRDSSIFNEIPSLGSSRWKNDADPGVI